MTLIEGIPLWLRRGAFYVAVACVTFASWWPRRYVDEYVSETIHYYDDITHAVIYAVLATATLVAWGCRQRPWKSRWWVWAGVTLFGLAMEIGQETIPGVNRSLELSDIISNAVGALVGVMLCLPLFWPARKPVLATDETRMKHGQ